MKAEISRILILDRDHGSQDDAEPEGKCIFISLINAGPSTWFLKYPFDIHQFTDELFGWSVVCVPQYSFELLSKSVCPFVQVNVYVFLFRVMSRP